MEKVHGTAPMTREEFEKEADRLYHETRAMLDSARRIGEETRQMAAEHKILLDALEKRLCGKK